MGESWASDKKGPRHGCTRGKTSPKVSMHVANTWSWVKIAQRRAFLAPPSTPSAAREDAWGVISKREDTRYTKAAKFNTTWLFPLFCLLCLAWYFYRVSYCTVAAAVPRTAASCFTPTWRRLPYKGTSYLPVAPVRSS